METLNLEKNALLNVIKKYDDDYSVVDKIPLYVKDPGKAKYQYNSKKCENSSLENLNNTKALIEYSNSNDKKNVYKNIDDYNPGRKCNVLKVFDDIIANLT